MSDKQRTLKALMAVENGNDGYLRRVVAGEAEPIDGISEPRLRKLFDIEIRELTGDPDMNLDELDRMAVAVRWQAALN